MLQLSPLIDYSKHHFDAKQNTTLVKRSGLELTTQLPRYTLTLNT